MLYDDTADNIPTLCTHLSHNFTNVCNDDYIPFLFYVSDLLTQSMVLANYLYYVYLSLLNYYKSLHRIIYLFFLSLMKVIEV